MILATEIWSERRYQRGVSASRAWLVTGAADEDQARTAPGIPQATSGFILDSRLLAAEPDVSSPDSPQIYRVGVEFSLPSTGGGTGGGNLGLPPTYHPQIGVETVEIDKDIVGNPLVNSARDSFDKPLSVRRASVRYIYRRWESNFDGPRSLLYSGRAVNIDTFNMPGFGFVSPGQAYCESITVANAFDRTATEVQVVYVFELRADGFLARILDQGIRANYYEDTTPKRATLFDYKGNKVSFPVRLDGYGAPFDDNVYYMDKNHSVSPAGLSTPPQGSEVELTASAAFLKYKVYDELPFTGLTLTT